MSWNGDRGRAPPSISFRGLMEPGVLSWGAQAGFLHCTKPNDRVRAVGAGPLAILPRITLGSAGLTDEGHT